MSLLVKCAERLDHIDFYLMSNSNSANPIAQYCVLSIETLIEVWIPSNNTFFNKKIFAKLTILLFENEIPISLFSVYKQIERICKIFCLELAPGPPRNIRFCFQKLQTIMLRSIDILCANMKVHCSYFHFPFWVHR